MKNIEIEIQVQVESVKPLLDFLKKEAKFMGEKNQIDEYFTPSHRNFIEKRPVGEWLRLRDSSGKYSINYKYWHYDKDGKSHYCDEHETPVENIESMQAILKALDFVSLIKVDKKRKIFNHEKYEISIDRVKKLGDFVEIEYKGNEQKVDPARITSEMVSFLKKIGVGKVIRNYVGYPYLMLFSDEIELEEL